VKAEFVQTMQLIIPSLIAAMAIAALSPDITLIEQIHAKSLHK